MRCGAAYRIRHIDMPATPERVWAAIEEGRRVHTLERGDRQGIHEIVIGAQGAAGVSF